MSRLAEQLELPVKSPEGENIKITRETLDQYGKIGKTFEATPVAEQSIIAIPAGVVIQAQEFFNDTSPSNSNKMVAFPHKTKAYNFTHITIEPDINLGVDEQETLKHLQFFLKNSTLKTKLNRADHISIPLSECVPFAIEYDGTQYTKRMIRPGFRIQDGIKIASNSEFEVHLVPAPNYSTHATNINPTPEQPNVIRLTMHGHALQVPAGV
jgi:hypothetical protein